MSDNHARPAARPDFAGADQRRKATPLPPFKHWATAPAPADAGCGVGLIGNLAMAAFILMAIGMAAVAIHQEERLAPHERQLLERRR